MNILSKLKKLRKRLRLFLYQTKLSSILRKTSTLVPLFGKKIRITDSASFLFLYDEIFHKEIYRFHSTLPKPLIIDCGANIGLSIIYFKRLFSNAEIFAFEPDSTTYEALKYNVSAFQFDQIELISKAVWTTETTLPFYPDSSDGGRLLNRQEAGNNVIQVTTVRLKDYLQRPVDLLKLDIEGAETEVLIDCAEALKNVKNVFIEYHSLKDQPQTADQILNILTAAGFKYYVEHIGIKSSHPFIKRNTSGGMDLQLNIYGTRN